MTYSALKTAPIAPQPPQTVSQWSAHPDRRYLEPISYANQVLLRAVVESWIDGILILSDQGQWVEANTAAQRICEQLCERQTTPSLVPETIWKICQELIQSRSIFPGQPVVVESDITVDDCALRMRVRWFALEETERPYLMVILEDRHQSNLNRAIAEVDQYHLSPREAEVWLLYRTEHTYKEIAQELYISFDTVKKHLRSIRNKQQKAKLI